jgi:hypothetical protein
MCQSEFVCPLQAGSDIISVAVPFGAHGGEVWTNCTAAADAKFVYRLANFLQ